MSFLSKVAEARDALQEHGRVSLRALCRELGLEGDDLDEIIEELVDVQQVALREGNVLIWAGDSSSQNKSKSEHGDLSASLEITKNYTPKHLAEKILANRSAMEGEKKQVSVLFCDVAGSMELAEVLGPEAWHKTLNEFFEVLTSAVHEFEGTVNQYTGDGIMALFGAPIAAEDHARRACMAALSIQDKLQMLRNRVLKDHEQVFSARIGINSGEVVVGKIGDDLRMDYTAQGQVVGIAARLESLAEPDAVLISPLTHKQVEGYFELASIGAHDIKGVSEPLELFRLGTAREDKTRLDVARERGFSRFVGREAEMALMQQALKRATSGNGQVISMVAPPGTGKSRLCWEFAEYCRAQGVNTNIVQAKSHGHMTPYEGMAWNASVFYRFKHDDPPEVKRRYIRERLAEYGYTSELALALTYEYCGVPDPDLAHLDISPEVRLQRYIRGTQWVLNEWCKEGTQVVIYEDLQWMDEASLNMLDLWIKASPGLNFLMILNYRPEFSPPWQHQEQLVQRLALQPLDHDAVSDMLAGMLGNDPSLTGLAERIIQASNGNPFFVEEIVRSLIEQGDLQNLPGQYRLNRTVSDLPLPDSVQNVLAARIDRLSDQDKHVLQSASVIGREFDQPGLAGVTDLSDAELEASLEALRRAEFIFCIDGRRWTFSHALTLDVAYGSLLQDKRQTLHQKIAEAMSQNIDSSNINLAELAHHWEAAGQLLEAALTTHRAAKAVVNRDVKEALRLRREFLRLEAAQPPSKKLVAGGIASRRVLLEWSGIDPLSRQEATKLYNEGKRLAEENQDLLRLGGLNLAYAMRLQNEARFTEAIELIEQVSRMVANVNHPALQVGLDAVYASSIYATGGMVDKALSTSENALALLEEHPELNMLGGANQLASARTWHGLALGFAGRLSEARSELRWVMDNTDQEDLFSIFADCWVLYLNNMTGISEDTSRMLQRLEQSIQQEIGGPWWQCGALGWAGLGHLAQGNPELAADYMQRSFELGKGNNGLETLHCGIRPWLALIKVRLGDGDTARRLLEENEAIISNCGSLNFQCGHSWLKSRVLRELDGADAIPILEKTLAQLEHAIDTSGMELLRHLWWWETARLAQLKGDTAGYRDGLEKALASAEACSATGHAGDIRSELKEIKVSA